MVKTKLLRYKCKQCGKVIESIYPNQLAFNKGLHEESHKPKEVKQ